MKGLGLGLVSAVAMTVVGAGTGIVQIGRGIVNTPAAIHAKATGTDYTFHSGSRLV
jgi:hypothetical protein